DRVLGWRRAEGAGQELGAADAGKDPEGRLGDAEDRGLAGDDEVGEDRELTSAGEGEAFHGGDDRDRTAQDPERRLLEDDVLGPPRLVGHLVAFLEVAAGAEGPVTRPREDDGPGV